jgi:hypothetical protein
MPDECCIWPGTRTKVLHIVPVWSAATISHSFLVTSFTYSLVLLGVLLGAAALVLVSSDTRVVT